MRYDVKVLDGLVFDGLGNPPARSNVYVSADRIARVSLDAGLAADETISASGLAVAPGFIDTHSHSDLLFFSDPLAKSKITQGVTTEIVGQDGFSVAPIRKEIQPELARYLSGLAGQLEDWKWDTFDSYLSQISELHTAINVASLVGNGTLRALTVGFDRRAPSEEELEQMKTLLAEAMEQGAVGMSSGLIYALSSYADENELVELCTVAARYGGVHVTHMRNEADRLMESVDEAIRITRRSKIPLHISHHKAVGRSNWGKTKQTLERIDSEIARGLSISCDVYPYTAGSTMLSALLPPWALEGGPKALRERLRDPELSGRIMKELQEGSPSWSSYAQLAGWDKILITYCKAPREVEGKSLAQISKEWSKPPAQTVVDLLLESEEAVSMVVFHISEDDVRRVVAHRCSTICTDGLLIGNPHPRAYGAFPRVLRRYVIEEKMLALESAIKKMTSVPASIFGLKDRGIIKEGAFADLVIFDPQQIRDTATYENPRQFAEGIRCVVVNGQAVLREGRLSETRPGRALRREGTTRNPSTE